MGHHVGCCTLIDQPYCNSFTLSGKQRNIEKLEEKKSSLCCSVVASVLYFRFFTVIFSHVGIRTMFICDKNEKLSFEILTNRL